MTNDQFNQLMVLEMRLQQDQQAAALADNNQALLNDQYRNTVNFDVSAAQQKVLSDYRARVEQARSNMQAGFADSTAKHAAVNDDNNAIQALLLQINTGVIPPGQA